MNLIRSFLILLEASPASGKSSQSVRVPIFVPRNFHTNSLEAIEYIKNLGRAHEAARTENARLRPEADYSRRAQEENELLKNELTAMWTSLRRLDPNNPHIYGSITGMLAQQQGNAPASTNNVLPPLQQQQQQPQAQLAPQQPQWVTPAPTAMQGVEFGGMRPYEHPHR